MTRELVLWLLEQGHQPVRLRPSSDDPVRDALEEAIALRELGNPQLSLAMLQRMHEVGLQSPWIQDNVARAWVDLGEQQRAIALWQELLQHNDRALAEQAADTLQAMLRPLREALQASCDRHHWAVRHLPPLAEPPAGNLLLAILQEVIDSREGQRPTLSLELIEISRAHGWNSPWLEDNQARALIHLGRHGEACTIWERLQHDADSAVAGEAVRMLGQYQPERIRHPLQDQLEALDADGRHDEAQTLLLEALSRDPDDALLWPLLEQRLQPQQAAGSELLATELEPVNRRLAAQECLLNHLEARLQRR